MLKKTSILVLLLGSCTAQTFDCGVVDIEAARVIVADKYPDAVDVFDRMDFFCVDDTDTFQTCRGEHTEACTMWIGSGPYRGKTFIDASENFEASIAHEAQHWHLMLLNNDDGCPSHSSACGWVD